jgi:hypothetical protein
MTVRSRRWLIAGGLAVVLTGIAVAILASQLCLSAWLFQGIEVDQCPDGRFRQTVSLQVYGLARERTGTVNMWATAHGAGKEYPGQQLTARVERSEAELLLVDSAGKETPLAPEKKWEHVGGGMITGQVKLPALPDGDYKLRARVTTPLGTDSAEAPLPLYAPARIHVLTDRPLYEPGHRVQFRAVALRAKDLGPLDGRPGTWAVVDPSGEVVLEERAPVGAWGVVSGTFPLDRGAPTGEWRVRWMSGAASGEASFQVEPFTLPRFSVEASSPQPFWRAGEVPTVEGQVVYSSGAPVAGAKVSLVWNHGGAWPPPTEWFERELPKEVKTDAAGRFKLSLPRVPADLRGQATLFAQLAAVDPAGDTVRGAVSLLLSEDALAVSAVTELEGGLVANYSNRVYLRATTADGQVLPGAELLVKRAWDPRDPGVRAVADEDGVAALQLDPGVPVNVVVPAMPVRLPPPPPPVELAGMQDLLAGDEEEGTLQDQIAIERWVPAFFPCTRFIPSETASAEVSLAIRVGTGGTVADVVSGQGRLRSCLAEVARTRTLPAGRERMLTLTLQLLRPQLPSLELEVETAAGESEYGYIHAALREAALDARACLPAKLSVSSKVPAVLRWRTRAGQSPVEVGWGSAPKEEGVTMLSSAALPCIQARFNRISLQRSAEELEEGEVSGEVKATQDAMGVAFLTAEPAYSEAQGGRPMDTTKLGYELVVSARVEGKEVGSTKFFLPPAQLPPQRLRANPVLAKAGDEVRVEMLRGPGFSGALPEKLFMDAGDKRLESKVEKSARTASFRLPADFEGWAQVQWGTATARVYVAPRAQLAVELAPEKPAYAPGEIARLQLRTRVDGREGPAAVGLFGVDESMAQLAPLLGLGAMGGLRPSPTIPSPAFGVLDGQALAMGRIRGANAAAAALLKVSDVPRPEEVEPSQELLAQSAFEPEVELTEPFYRVLAELTTQVRTWEEKAPEGETLSPAGMAKLWEQALAACEKRGEPVTDAYGRRLKLSRLPPDLLFLTDPRVVVVGGTRLSEDVEDWGAWIAREVP